MTSENPYVEDAFFFDRGQPITVSVAWDADPEDVYFSCTPPGEEIPVVDDGYGQPTSRIEKLADDAYRVTFSTERFASGVGSWRFWGETSGVCVVAKSGKFGINEG